MTNSTEDIATSENYFSLVKMYLDLVLKDTKQKLAREEKKEGKYWKQKMQKQTELNDSKELVKRKEFELKDSSDKLEQQTIVKLKYKDLYFKMLEELNISPEGKVIYGNVTQSKEIVMKVNIHGDVAIIDWDNFNLSKNTSIEFMSKNPDTKITNNIKSEESNYIEGAISSDGKLEFLTKAPLGLGGDISASNLSIRVGYDFTEINISETIGSTIVSGEIDIHNSQDHN